ncbi:ATP/GTP-binding protein [Streptomyces sp. ND04-05B]|uniref:ATP/GTP-binding protein n=1 Tax=Streptomyces sp. ND04-05B TaxID=3028693 RepID=UPI0029B3D771|nr:ATP/GTP-binding protein [Streptomyces sp. ND04-05B]MDX3060688.1 ATP/GTP-binding protein [Streptomyces sp. ND04-05B]
MDTEGTYEARGTGAAPPRPAGPPPSTPPRPAAPPPGHAPAAGPGLAEWLRTPRPEREPGVWRYGHTPRPPEKPEGVSDRSLLVGVLISALCGLLLWSLWRNGYIPYRLVPLKLFTPGDWWYAGTFGGPRTIEGGDALTVYEAVLFGLLVYGCGRLGNWSEIFGRHVVARGLPFLALTTAAAGALAQLLVWKDAVPVVRPVLILVASVAGGEVFQSQTVVNVIYTLITLGVLWPFARLGRWRELIAGRRKGAAALHPSGARDLPRRTARHDLLTGQVRIGNCAEDPHNPYVRRGSGVALEPALLGTSLLAVGPPGAGKSDRLVRPVVESLALQALAGRAAVLAVGGAGEQLGPDEAYDVVVRIGDPASVHDFDLYGGTTDPDEAAGVLAEGLVGDVTNLDSRRAATVLAQLLGPYRAVHGHFPGVPALRELLDGDLDAIGALREALGAGGHQAMLRELEARTRQKGGSGDPGPVLADRIALLDRPAFASFFATGPLARPFSLRSLEHLPLRVRIDLPERAHAEASRLLARLVLAQFTAIAAARTDRSLFVCLVLDDATHTVTAETVRGVRRLRSVNAGAVLTLRTVDDVPEGLHTALLGAVGCCMAFSGVTTWDGKRFAEVWGKEWVETREVAQHAVFADQPFTRALHGLRKLVTGKAVTRDAVTVRQVERERWSASELAYSLPTGHAVLSLTTVDGEHAPPLLVDLGG